VLGVVALGVVACGKTSPEPPIAWYSRIAPACAAANRQDRPLLFINWASWDVLSHELDNRAFDNEPLRQAIRHDWVALRVDRSDVYMQEGNGSEQEHEVEEAQRRFKPWASKYATIVLLAPDCETEIGRIDHYEAPPELVEQLAAARKKLLR
jgi:hypothetical protein